jgi:hypothetical protein
LLEAARCGQIDAVPVKSPRQHGLQALHRVREQLKSQRTATINLVRGLLREYGLALPAGAARLAPGVQAAVEDAENELPMSLRATLADLLERIGSLQRGMKAIEVQLTAEAEQDVTVQRYQRVPGVGLLTATALRAGAGDLSRFRSGRHLAAWLGLVPREHSSGQQRRLGAITKRGDPYVRTLAYPRRTHGTSRGVGATTRWPGAGAVAILGAGGAATARPQQGRRCARQQDRPTTVGHRLSRPGLRSGSRQPQALTRQLPRCCQSVHDEGFGPGSGKADNTSDSRSRFNDRPRPAELHDGPSAKPRSPQGRIHDCNRSTSHKQ